MIKLGFIGAGNIIKSHMAASRDLGLDLHSVYDVDNNAVVAAAQEYKIRNTFTDLGQMLADPDVQAVIIGTPNKFHAEQAVAALDAGKHVLLEKPMAMNAAECDAIIKAKDRNNKVLQIGMVNRFRSPTIALKRILDSGRCGHIYSGQTFWYRRRGIPGFGGWFTNKAVSGGGGLIDIGVHMLDLALYLMGFPKPVAVTGMTYNVWHDLNSYVYTSMWGKPTPGGKKDVDDYAVALVRFADGQSLNVNVSWALNIGFANPEMGLRLMGEKGGVALEGMDHPFYYGEDLGQLIDTKVAFAPNAPMLEEQRAFVNSIRENAPIVATAEQGRTVQSILDAIYKSSETKREVILD